MYIQRTAQVLHCTAHLHGQILAVQLVLLSLVQNYTSVHVFEMLTLLLQLPTHTVGTNCQWFTSKAV
jgi:hypothetical protein